MTPPALAPTELDAIARFFDGDQALYLAFRSTCLTQFQADLQEGEQLNAAGDLEALRRLVHSLKSVLQTLGHADLSVMARDAEHAAKALDAPLASAGWERLRDGLVTRFGLKV